MNVTMTDNDYGGNSSIGTEPDIRNLAVIGLPGLAFTVIHVTALVILSISATVSACLLIYLFGGFDACLGICRRDPDYRRDSDPDKGATTGNSLTSSAVLTDPRISRSRTLSAVNALDADVHIPTKTGRSNRFWGWSIGQRLVVYLAISDLFMSVSHLLDHAYMYHERAHPPDLVCSVFGFVLQIFILAEWSVVVFTAVSACSLIVFEKELRLGRYDWRLLVLIFGLPLAVSTATLSLGLNGQSGAWCLIDLRKPFGRWYSHVVGFCQVTEFILVAGSYVAIWVTVQRRAKLVDHSTWSSYRNLAKVMLLFVAVFIWQWWTTVLYCIWHMVSDEPPAGLIVVMVTLVNLGGVYNCIVYTIIRRRIQQQSYK